MIWAEMEQARGTHIKQQKMVGKLVQYIVALLPNNQTQRLGLGKRHILALNEPSAGSKRIRLDPYTNNSGSYQMV